MENIESVLIQFNLVVNNLALLKAIKENPNANQSQLVGIIGLQKTEKNIVRVSRACRMLTKFRFLIPDAKNHKTIGHKFTINDEVINQMFVNVAALNPLSNE